MEKGDGIRRCPSESCLLCRSSFICDKSNALDKDKALGNKNLNKKSEKLWCRRMKAHEISTLCSVLNIPWKAYKSRLLKSSLCLVCCDKVKNITNIVSALEKLQGEIKLFRFEILELLQITCLKDSEALQIRDQLENDFKSLRLLRFDILIDLLNKIQGVSSIESNISPRCDEETLQTNHVLDNNEITVNINAMENLEPGLQPSPNIKEEPLSPHPTLQHTFPSSPNLYNISKYNWETCKTECDEEFICGDPIPPNPPTSSYNFRNIKSRQQQTSADKSSRRSSKTSSISRRDSKKFKNSPKRNIEKQFNKEQVEKIRVSTNLLGPENVTTNKNEGVKTLPCAFNKCSKTFLHHRSLKNHLKSHVVERKSLKCNNCDKTFINASSLSRHMSSHTGVWKYPCDKCNKGFSRPGELKLHVARIHDLTPLFQCDFCDLKLDTKRKLYHHCSMMHPERNNKFDFRCDYCNKVFSSGDTLKCHQIHMHTQKFSHFCNVCNQGFAKKSWLERHQLRHSNEKNYHCDICPEKFRYPNSLAVHRARHEGTFPYSCPICGKKFVLRSQYNMHLPIHNKSEKLAVCEFCGKGFSIGSYLRHHKKRIHFRELGLDAPPPHLMRNNRKKSCKPKKSINENGSTVISKTDFDEASSTSIVNETTNDLLNHDQSDCVNSSSLNTLSSFATNVEEVNYHENGTLEEQDTKLTKCISTDGNVAEELQGVQLYSVEEIGLQQLPPDAKLLEVEQIIEFVVTEETIS